MNLNKNIEFILVYGELFTGGIDTLIVRLANYLVEHNFNTNLIIKQSNDLLDILDKKINIIYYSNFNDYLKSNENINFIKYDKTYLILSFDSSSAARAELLELLLFKNLKSTHISGIFHPQWYFMRDQPWDRLLFNRLIAKSIGYENIFYMNEECRFSHSKKWKTNLDNSPIIPLPIKDLNYKWTFPNNNEIKIISVGRLVDTKAYNIGAPKIIKICLNYGFNIHWDIYGYGPLESEIIERSINLNVNSCINLKGKLNYSKFETVVSKYDLFIGHGTAALESAMLGVPSICALIDEENASYGYISDLPFGNVGEVIQNKVPFEISSMILQYILLSPHEKKLLSNREKVAASKYNISNFLDSLIRISNFSIIKNNYFLRLIVAKIFFEFTEGLIAKNLLGKGYKTKLLNLFNFMKINMKFNRK